MRAIKTTTISILIVGLLAGSAVGVAAQDEGATEVTGTVTFGEPIAMPEAEETPDGIVINDGIVVSTIWDTSDARLDGEATYSVNAHGVLDCCAIQSEAYVLTNDGGSWVGDGRSYSTENGRSGFVALSGRDGYEGLTAYVATELADSGNAWDLKGVIFPSEMPEVPEPYAAE